MIELIAASFCLIIGFAVGIGIQADAIRRHYTPNAYCKGYQDAIAGRPSEYT